MVDKGVTFAVPQLCLDFGDGAELADREACLADGWSLSSFSAELPAFVVDESRHVYEFDMAFRPGHYPAKSFYRGKVKFQKHFYASIGDMDSKDEVICAQYIDAHPMVETTRSRQGVLGRLANYRLASYFGMRNIS